MIKTERHPLCEQFLGWQCRIRQHAVRKQEGQPPRGIGASVKIDGSFSGQIATMICKADSAVVTAEFRFMVQKTADPKKRYDNALKFLCEYYYQFPNTFDERLTALFAIDSEVASRLVNAEEVALSFFQGNQKYLLPCTAVDQPQSSPLYEATYWHNYLFNPRMPGVVRVVSFEVDWDRATFEQVDV